MMDYWIIRNFSVNGVMQEEDGKPIEDVAAVDGGTPPDEAMQLIGTYLRDRYLDGDEDSDVEFWVESFYIPYLV